MPITIQLYGSATATFGEATYTARGNGHDPIPPLVRSLIAEKVIDADVLVTVARGDLVCFKSCRAILWAEIDVADSHDGIVRGPAYIGPTRRGLSLWPTDWEPRRAARGGWDGPYRTKRGPEQGIYQRQN